MSSVERPASQMARLIEEKDWSETPVGAAATWSPALRMILSLLLANRFPQLLWWGNDYIQFYNDAYKPIPGAKHPKSLGQSARECWSEVWHVLQPLVDTPFNGGPPTWIEDFELELHRSTHPEETHFTVAYSPVPDASAPNGIGGVLATVHEITGKVISERRLALLRELASHATEGRTAEDACSMASETLATDPKDLPFTVLYLLDAERKNARLVGTAGVEAGHVASPTIIDLSTASVWGQFIRSAVRGNAIVTVDGIASILKMVPPGPWSDPPQSAVVVPIPSAKSGDVQGLFITGVSARLELNDDYKTFFKLIAAQVANAVSNAEAYEAERRRAEALAEIDRAKTTFFSNVSHEFRTPLTLMLGPLQDLLSRSQTHLSPTAKEQLDLVNRNGARLLRLVNTLLDFSRIEAGRVQAVYQATDLAGFTSELASVFRSATEKAGLRLIVNCRPLAEPVYVDRDMWEKIVLNLISNAFKFTFDGEIEVSMDRTGDHAVLRVRDTGVGIPPEALPRIFERFHRVADVRSRTHEGSGIGLALVQELVKLHGGSIRAESSVGHGTIFIVSVPFGQSHVPLGQLGGSRTLSSTAVGAEAFVEEALRWLPDEPKTTEEVFAKAELLPVPCPPMSEPSRRPRILIADDNSDMRQYLARLLSEQYEVETVPDGQHAIDAARQRPPDLILSDVMMPVLDGFDLLRAIRSDERTRRIPVVLLSARAGEESRVEGMQAGADDYLIKPFSARELLARISARLEIARLQRESEQRVAADLLAMSRLQEIGNLCVGDGNDFHKCLDEIVAGAIDLTGAKKGNLELLDPRSGVLRLSAQRGFEEPFLKFFDTVRVRDVDSACGEAMGSVKRVLIEDVSKSDIFKGQPSLDVLLQAGVRAVQSTPLLSSNGRLLGVISTHFSEPHLLGDRESRLMDLLARQAADYLERKQAEEDLRQRTEQFETLLNEAPLGVYVLDSELHIRQVNPVAIPVFGNIPDLIGRDFEAVMHTLWGEDHADEIVGIFRHTLDSGEPYHAPEFIKHRIDRNVTEYYEWSINRIPLPDGDQGVVCYFRDISAQVSARLTIVNSEKRLASEAAELLKLNELSSRLWRIGSLEEGFQEMLEAAITLVGGAKGTLQIYDPQRAVLSIAAQRGFAGDFLDHFKEVSAADDSACGRTLRFQRPFVVEDIETDLPFTALRPIARAAGYQAVVCSPLIDAGGTLLGIFAVHFPSVHKPSNETLQRFELYGRQAADFISRCKIETALRERAMQQRLLAGISDLSFAGHDSKSFGSAAAEMVARHFGVSRCGLSRVDVSLGTVTVEQDYSYPLPSLAGEYPLKEYASYYFDDATAGVPSTFGDLRADPRTASLYDKFYAPISVRSFLTVPLHREGTWMGNFWMCHHEPREWDQKEVALLKTIADRIWLGVENARVSEDLRRSEAQLRVSQAELESKVQERTKELLNASQELRDLSTSILRAQDEERRRIARELHDGAGQLLAALSMEVANIAADRDKLGGKTATSVGNVESLIAQMTSGIRTMSHLLYPPLLDEVGLSSALSEYVNGFSDRSGIKVILDVPSRIDRLGRDFELCVFRIVQECLTNIHRHSESKVANIRIARVHNALELEVRDEGRGISELKLQELRSGGGVGLRGMRERVRQFSGNMNIDSDGMGMRVQVTIPIPRPSSAAGSDEPLQATGKRFTSNRRATP